MLTTARVPCVVPRTPYVSLMQQALCYSHPADSTLASDMLQVTQMLRDRAWTEHSLTPELPPLCLLNPSLDEARPSEYAAP